MKQVDDDENLSSQQPNLPIGPGWGIPNDTPIHSRPNPFRVRNIPLSGSITTSDVNFTTTVWNDQMGNWHYTNYPEGFGYYTTSAGTVPLSGSITASDANFTTTV